MERAGGRDDGTPRGIAPSPTVSHALELAATGDRDALAFLYARFADDVHEHLLAALASRDDADKLIQRLFASLPELIERHGGPPDSPLPWLLQVARELHRDPYPTLRPVPIEAACRRAAGIAASAAIASR